MSDKVLVERALVEEAADLVEPSDVFEADRADAADKRACAMRLRAALAEQAACLPPCPGVKVDVGAWLRQPLILELLAALEHERWANWMRYQDSAPEEKRKDWPRKTSLRYGDMTNQEQESDRIEARKTINALVNAWDREMGGPSASQPGPSRGCGHRILIADPVICGHVFICDRCEREANAGEGG